MVSCLSVRYFFENSRTLESWTLSSRAKMESKLRACDSQAGSLVNAASGEFEDGRNPAKNRAVSSAVAASELRAGAALSVSINVTRIAAINLGIDRHMFQAIFCVAIYQSPVRNCRWALYGDIETAVGLSASARVPRYAARIVSKSNRLPHRLSHFDAEAAGFDLGRAGLRRSIIARRLSLLQ